MVLMNESKKIWKHVKEVLREDSLCHGVRHIAEYIEINALQSYLDTKSVKPNERQPIH